MPKTESNLGTVLSDDPQIRAADTMTLPDRAKEEGVLFSVKFDEGVKNMGHHSTKIPEPPLLCDGCNVRTPHEHRCWGEIKGDPNGVGLQILTKKCECPDCNDPNRPKF